MMQTQQIKMFEKKQSISLNRKKSMKCDLGIFTRICLPAIWTWLCCVSHSWPFIALSNIKQQNEKMQLKSRAQYSKRSHFIIFPLEFFFSSQLYGAFVARNFNWKYTNAITKIENNRLKRLLLYFIAEYIEITECFYSLAQLVKRKHQCVLFILLSSIFFLQLKSMNFDVFQFLFFSSLVST